MEGARGSKKPLTQRLPMWLRTGAGFFPLTVDGILVRAMMEHHDGTPMGNNDEPRLETTTYSYERLHLDQTYGADVN